jgi:hypothetical protein
VPGGEVTSGRSLSGVAGRCIIYIVRRTQLYIEDDLWTLVSTLARRDGRTVSDLLREALREKYGRDRVNRKEAFEGVIGLWKNRKDLPPAEDYVRAVRRGSRLDNRNR